MEDETGTQCVARLKCDRIKLESSGEETCLDAKTCPENLALLEDGKHCVDSCPEGFARGRDGAGSRVCVC